MRASRKTLTLAGGISQMLSNLDIPKYCPQLKLTLHSVEERMVSVNTNIPDSTKKTYETPQMVVYGDVREMTKHNISGGTFDGGLFGGVKTA